MNRPLKTKPSAKLRVGFVFDDSLDSNDGVSQYVKILGRWMSGQGHTVSYLVGETKMTTYQGGRVYSLSKNIGVAFNKNRLSIPLPSSKAPIKKILEQTQFDVLHVQVPYSPFMAKQVISQAGTGTAVIGTFHIVPAGRLAYWGSQLLKPVYGKSLKRFDGFIGVSKAAAKYASLTLGVCSEVIPLPIELDRFKHASTKNSPQTKASQRVVFLGRLVERKGCQELLEAFGLVVAQHPDVQLVIAGDGPLRKKLEKYVSDNNLSQSVSFLGFITEEEKPSLLASADIACFPSTAGESFGIVLLEAMASGAKVVLGGRNEGYDTVLSGQPGLLIDPADTKAFANRISDLLTDKNKALTLNQWQNEYVKGFDVGVVGPRVMDFYVKAIAKRRQNKHN